MHDMGTGRPGDRSSRGSPSRARPRVVHRLAPLVGLAVLVVVVVVAWRHGNARAFLDVIGRARPAWLAVALALQGATYFSSGGVWWLALRRAGAPQPLRLLVVLSVAKLFTDQAVPSGGIAGSALLIRAVVRRGTPAGVATAGLVANLLGFYASLVFAAALAFIFLRTHHAAGPLLIWLAGGLLVLSVAVPSALFFLVKRGRSRTRDLLAKIGPVRRLVDAFAQAPRERVRDPVVLVGATALQFLTIALDAATLASTLEAVGIRADVRAAFASFVFAMIAENVGFVPGGLGTFEATGVATLHACGVPIEPALTATLLLRGLTFWLPMLPGLWFGEREIAAGTARAS